MNSFEEGFDFFNRYANSTLSAAYADEYVWNIEDTIQKLEKDLNGEFAGNNAAIEQLKGDVAEFWHADTYNIKVALQGGTRTAYVPRSNELGSADIVTPDGSKYSSKYYGTAAASASQQAKSIFEKYAEYQGRGGQKTFEEYLEYHHIPDDTVLNDSIYKGQNRLVPKGQLEEARKWLARKIAKLDAKDVLKANHYRETLEMLTDRVHDNLGAESVPITTKRAEQIARQAKKGNFSSEKAGITPESLLNYQYIANQAFNAGVGAAALTTVMTVAPDILQMLEYLIKNGELEEGQLKKLGLDALRGAGEGFFRGFIAAGVTVCCESGLWGSALKSVEPAYISALTVIVISAIKNAYKVETGSMSRAEMAECFVRDVYVSSVSVASASLIQGLVMQSAIPVPVLGFMLGSFIGSVLAYQTYKMGKQAVISFCLDSGFTMFGLVKQDYTLPAAALNQLGIATFDYDHFECARFKPDRFKPITFEPERFELERIDMIFLRRGVIGVNLIG